MGIEAASTAPLARRAMHVVAVISLAIVAVAGLAKLTDITAFAASLESWQTVPPWLIVPIVVVVPGAELALLIAFLLLPRDRRLICACAGLLLVSFAAMHLVEGMLHTAPECNCFGILQAYFQRMSVLREGAVVAAALAVGPGLFVLTARRSA